MTFLAKAYYRDLLDERVTGDEFSAANREVSKRNRFYPVMADILTAVDSYRRQQSKMVPKLADIEWKRNFPELLTEEEAVVLGVGKKAIDAAKRSEATGEMKRLIQGIGG